MLQNVVGARYVATIGNDETERIGLPHEVDRRDVAQVVAIELVRERRLAPNGERTYVGPYIHAATGGQTVCASQRLKRELG